MSAAAAARPVLPRPLLGLLLGLLPGLLLGLACFGLLFHAEMSAAVAVWIASTAYSHCFLVPPIALWLAWDRRHVARGRRPAPTAWPALAVPPLALAWFAAERLGLMEGRQLAALGMLEALLVALLGWRLARAQAPALIYLVFLVPVGGFLVPALRHVTAGFIDLGLSVLGIPHFVDVFTIEIPEGVFYVAEACAGLRFLIAAVAFGALYGFVIYRGVGRRLAFLAACVVVPILANGLRAFGIVLAGHIIGNAEAAAADHIIYGWGFFSVVILLLALAGLPFREPPPPADAAPAAPMPPPPMPPPPMPATRTGRALWAAGTVTLLAAAGPAAVAALNRPGAVPHLRPPGFAATAACLSLGDPPGPEQRFSCAGSPLVASIRVLPANAAPALLRAAVADATGERDAAESVVGTLAVDGALPGRWRLVELQQPDRLIATAAWIDGAPDPGGLASRLRMAWRSVAGGGAPPVLVAVALSPPPLTHAEDRDTATGMLRDFIRAQAPVLVAIGRIGGD